MKKLCLLFPLLLFISVTCEDEQVEEVDTTPPIVTITYPQSGSSVYEIVTITCMSTDDNGVEKVELWVNGISTGLTDSTEPYSFNWNTISLEDGNNTIIVRSYDTSGNITDSESIVLTVDNTLSIPTPSELNPITYNDGFQIIWSQNNDDDFVSYKLFESTSEDMSNQVLLYETENITDTTFFKTLQNFRYYQIVVEDLWGFQSTSNIEYGDYYIEIWGSSYSFLNTTYLNLGSNQLTGSIPPEIGNLTYLDYLDLKNNLLTGSIPPEIGNLTNLTRLYLYENKLTGSIPPEIGNLTNLVILHLDYNQLTGSIPPEIGNLTNLTYLSFGNSQLTGSIPPEIGNLTNLTQLFLHNNQLTGSIPPEIGNLINLTYLYLYDNQLTGVIPESICDLDIYWNGNSFSISNNQLCPPYPSCIEDHVGGQDTTDCP